MSIYKTNSFETIIYFLIKDKTFLEKDNKIYENVSNIIKKIQ